MMGKKWANKEVELLENNYRILSIRNLADKLNRTENSIRMKAGKLNLIKYHFWTVEEIEYLKNNYLNNDPDTLKLNLNNHSYDVIKMKANSFGLKKQEYKLAINEDFFKIWTPEMAYIFGFWVADGNMGKNEYSISFASNDFSLLDMIRYKLNSKHKISKSCTCFLLQINNKIMYNDLLKLGGIPAKSLIIQFPEVPDEYLPHFIRGYFDGDGSFYISKNGKYRYLGSSFAGNIDFLTILKNKIKENININPTSFCIANKNCNKRIYQIQYFGKKAIALGDYIYQNSENLRLERKYNIYKKMKEEFIKKLEEKKCDKFLIRGQINV